MRLFFIIVSFTLAFSVSSQVSLPAEIIVEEKVGYPVKDTSVIEDIFTVCIFPEEPSVDLEKWKAYLRDSLVLDDASMDTIPAGKHTVIVQFEVVEKGKLTNISIVKEAGYGLGERVKKVLSNCTGLWEPVKEENGQIVRSYRRQPITFVVEENCEELPKAFTL